MSLFAAYEPRDRADAPRPPPPAELAIRPATIGDAPAVARLIAEREGGELGRSLGKITTELAREDIGRQRLLVVAELDNAIVGFGRVLHWSPAADAPPNVAPRGWYFGGVIVAPTSRRRGIGHELTRWRVAWLRDRGVTDVWFAVNADNRPSIDLHAVLGFREVTRDFVQPGVRFSGRGEGILFRLELSRGGRDAATP